MVKKILETKGKTNITIISKDNIIETVYTFKHSTKNNYFYQCSKRPKCRGYGKFNKVDSKFYITTPCIDNDIHNKLTKNIFQEFINNNQLKKIDFNIKKTIASFRIYI